MKLKIGPVGWMVLGISGAVAMLALAAPTIVVLGYLLLFIPGLILTVAPTFFVYLAATLAIREFVPIRNKIASTAFAFVCSLALSWVVMQPIRASQIEAYQAALKPDILPNQPVKLDGHVRIEIENCHVEPGCDYLCANLLSDFDIQSVTRMTSRKDNQQEEAFALISSKVHPEPGLFPTNPGEILRQTNRKTRFDQLKLDMKSLEAEWALRLADDLRLVEHKPVTQNQADWIVRRTKSGGKGEPKVERVEVIDSNGDVQFRKSLVEHVIPRSLFYFGFDVHMGAGTISGASFHVGRKKCAFGEKYFDSEKCMLAAIKLPAPVLADEKTAPLRERIVSILDDPHATPADLELSRRWLSIFDYDASDEDFPIIARILSDERIADLKGPMEKVVYRNKTPADLRIACADRILMPQSTEAERKFFADMLSHMPTSTFAAPDPKHIAIWTDANISRDAYQFIGRIADVPANQATQILLMTLNSSFELESQWNRRPILEEVQQCFIDLGPAAASAIPEITELFHTRKEMFFGNSGAESWRLALARMGMPIEDLPLREFESQQPQTYIDNIHARTRQKLERYRSKKPRHHR